ncbi:MAG: Exodeoxyribonuclease 7 small subunit [Planctomycetaceae bacterium]|nr:Exodeoxyribonuclease 7 small subunit [Planctomycetaceae bacterium]
MTDSAEFDSGAELFVSAPPVAPSFEEAIRDLQQIVSELESGSITLDASLKRFEQGIGLLRQCYQFLDRTEQRIEQLVSLDAAGNCTLVAFDATATADKPTKPATAKSTARKAARTKESVEPASVAEAPDEPEIPGKLLF